MCHIQSHLKILTYGAVVGLWLLTATHAHAEPKSRAQAYLDKEVAACGDIHKPTFTKEAVPNADADEHWSFRRLTEVFLKRRQTNRAVAEFFDRFKNYVEEPDHKFNQDDLMKFNELGYALKQKMMIAHGVCLADLYGINTSGPEMEVSDRGYEARTADTDKLLDDKSITADDITRADSFPISDSIYKKRGGKQQKAED